MADKFTTPRGTLQWVFISGKGREDLNGKAIYTADVVLTPEDAKPLTDRIDTFWDENKPKGASSPKSLGYKEKEGKIVVTLKTGTTYPSGDDKAIGVFDAKAKRVDLGDTRIGNSSVGRLGGAMAIYDAGKAARGVTLYLDNVQVSKLVEYEGDASFDEDDDGDFEGSSDDGGFGSDDLLI